MMTDDDAAFEALLKVKVEEALAEPRPDPTVAEVEALQSARHAARLQRLKEQGR